MARKPKTTQAPVEETTEAPVEETTEDSAFAEQLVEVAAELNACFGLNPEIDVNLPVDQLEELVREANKETLAADEKDLSPATWKFLQDNKMIEHLKPAPKAEKPAPKSGGNKKGGFTKQPDTDKRNARIEELIKEGKWTAVEIADKVSSEFPEHKRSSIQTMISDSKNPKYNKFNKLAVMDASTKVLSFSK